MNANEFCYWLQGFIECADPKKLDEKQISMIKKHLDLVFVNVTDKSSKDLDDLVGKVKRSGGWSGGGMGQKYC